MWNGGEEGEKFLTSTHSPYPPIVPLNPLPPSIASWVSLYPLSPRIDIMYQLGTDRGWWIGTRLSWGLTCQESCGTLITPQGSGHLIGSVTRPRPPRKAWCYSTASEVFTFTPEDAFPIHHPRSLFQNFQPFPRKSIFRGVHSMKHGIIGAI